jgi:RNA polymerase sporulation-specific sigma factor
LEEEHVALRIGLAVKTPAKVQQELEDLQLVLKARNGSSAALDTLMRRYASFVRLKASAYFLVGGSQETSFRSFAELCVTRQIITAIKSATRYKHSPLNNYVSFGHTPSGQDGDGDCTLGDALPGSNVNDPAVRVISTEELQSLVGCLGTTLSSLESDALRLYLEGSTYEEMAEQLACDTKTIDNALQRVKRKILSHQRERQVLL